MFAKATPWFVVFIFVAGCLPKAEREVIVYTALDREFSEPILNEFRGVSKIEVLPKYDAESTKTVQLVTPLLNEANRPRCDVFWNNEILHTLRLQKAGVLDVYESPRATEYPQNYRASDGSWYGFAARARVLIVNTDIVAEAERPDSIHDLTDPKWQGKVGIAKPLFGTTATHAAVLFAQWGTEAAKEFFGKVRANARTMSGNKHVATSVGRGQLAFGITDTDDAIVEIENGRPVAIIFPDQGSNQLGTLFIPNTLCIIKGGPNPEHAREFVDFVLSSNIEDTLALGRSAQFPLNKNASERSRVLPEEPLRWMDVDFMAAADAWETAQEYLKETFATAD